MLTEEVVRGFNTLAKMNPPLRTWQDVQAIKDGLRDGTIDAIATTMRRTPPRRSNIGFTEAPFGIVGLETALSLRWRWWRKAFSLESAIEKLSAARQGHLAWPKGTLTAGADADVAIIDPQAQWKVDPGNSARKAATPLCGWKVKGLVVTTIVADGSSLRRRVPA